MNWLYPKRGYELTSKESARIFLPQFEIRTKLRSYFKSLSSKFEFTTTGDGKRIFGGIEFKCRTRGTSHPWPIRLLCVRLLRAMFIRIFRTRSSSYDGSVLIYSFFVWDATNVDMSSFNFLNCIWWFSRLVSDIRIVFVTRVLRQMMNDCKICLEIINCTFCVSIL